MITAELARRIAEEKLAARPFASMAEIQKGIRSAAEAMAFNFPIQKRVSPEDTATLTGLGFAVTTSDHNPDYTFIGWGSEPAPY